MNGKIKNNKRGVWQDGSLLLARQSQSLRRERYIEKTGSSYTYYYYLKDHLGNTRIVMNSSGTVVQANNYYPSGTSLAERRTDQGIQPYKYNGIELDRSYSLDLYDYDARMFDPVMMQFMRPDPLSEKYYWITLYAYCLNNPVNAIDPDGRNPILALYRAYKSYKAYRAVRAATVTMGAADAAAVATATSATAAYSYNYFLNPEQAAKAQQSLLSGIENVANQNAAVSPEYNNQRKREGDARDKRNQEQANVVKSVDTNVSGTMPNGDPAPKRDPNDGGNKTKIAIGVAAIGAGAAVVESIVEGTQSQEVETRQPPQQPEVKPQEPPQSSSWWQNFLNLFR